MTSIGITAYNDDEYEKFIKYLLDVPDEDEEYPQAYDRDHEDSRPDGRLGHVYNADLVQPSNHDWVSSVQIVGFDKYGEPILRKEFYEGEIQARMESVADSDDLDIHSNESVCVWCNLTTLAQTKCVNCDEYVS
jgi:hypothetical protein